MILLTEKAAIKIKEIAASEGLVNMVRLKVLSGGCSGFTRDMYFDEQVSDMDEIVEDETGVKMIVDPISFQYLDGTVIDYIEDFGSGGFKFLNSNITGSCGCGKSVSY